MMFPTLFTRRTVLEPLSRADAPQIQRVFDDWEVVKYLNARIPWPYPADGAERYLREALPEMEAGDAWHWSIRLRSEPSRIIGCVEVMNGDESNRGFWLGTRWQRQGLMTEVVQTTGDYWFDVLGRDVLRAYKAIANTGSRRISENVYRQSRARSRRRSGVVAASETEPDFVKRRSSVPGTIAGAR